MTTVNEFVRDVAPPPAHPLLRYLDAKLRDHTAVCHLEVPARLVGYAKAQLSVRLFQGDQEVELKTDDWDDELNDGLISRGIKADSPQNEQERFALALRASFKRAENRYGDGFFNSVLVTFILNSGFRSQPAFVEVLKHVPHIKPHEGQEYYDCREMIEHGVRTRGRQLSKDLMYAEEQGVAILSGALALYLDERFSVTNRRLLGLL